MSETETPGGGDSQAPGFADDLSKAFDEIESEMPLNDDATFETQVSDAGGDSLDALDGEIVDDMGGVPSEAPEHWSQDDKDRFAELPDEAKPLYLAKVKSLESGYNRKFEELADERRGLESYRGFDDLFRPFEEDLAAAGITAEQYTRQLVATALQMRQNPEATLAALAQSHGVDLGDLVGKLNGAGDALDDELTDPAIQALRQENATLRQGLQGLSAKIDQSQDFVRQAGDDEIVRDFAVFALSTDDAGNERYPHALDLQQHIGTELAHNPPVLGEAPHQAFARAYEAVKWHHAELRNALLRAEAEKARHEGRTEALRKADVDKARRAGRTLTSKSMPVDDAPRETSSWKEEVERQWDEAATAA